MTEEIERLRRDIENELADIATSEELEAFRLKHLVKKGSLADVTKRFKDVPPADKPAIGKQLNELRQFANTRFQELQNSLQVSKAASTSLDLSLAGRKPPLGTAHPISQMIDEFVRIFGSFGFDVADGPEIEDDYHNFDALNFAPNHPARDMQDTFFLADSDENLLLRTHTSPAQIRLMRTCKPPLRFIVPGRVYRNEAIDSTHLAEFYQVEGLYVDRNVSLADLKGTLIAFVEELFEGRTTKYRFRPSFFPFTEPSAEFDVLFSGSKGEAWLEMGGCGMVHPNVLQNCGIDPEEYTGFAFGFGVERLAMLKHGIDNIRLFYENDVRVLRQLS